MSHKTTDFGYDDIPQDQKQSKVREVFDSVAGNYDLMNDAMSLGIHRVWKDMTITKVNPQPGELLIDVAGGTGDLARRFIKKAEEKRSRRSGGAKEKTKAFIVDINAEMLLAGFDESKDAGLDMRRVCGNAESLPFEDNICDAVTIAFGIRNVTHRDKALSEFHRILKPGGRLAVLEFSTPPEKFLRSIYDAYSFNVIPRLGDWLANDGDSYKYLVESIRRFPRQDAFADMVKEAGFSRVSWQNYSGGIACLHFGWKV